MFDLYNLLYVSQSTTSDAGEVLAIETVSQSNNQRDDITGLLLFDGKAWCQYIEGPERSVADLYARLRRDRRHRDMSVMQHGAVDGPRAFPDWRMGYAYVADEQAIANVLRGERGEALEAMRAMHRSSTKRSSSGDTGA